MQSHALICSYVDMFTHSFIQSHPDTLATCYLMHEYGHIFMHAHKHTSSLTLWLIVSPEGAFPSSSYLLLLNPLSSVSLLSPFDPQPVLGGSPALWTQPWKEILSSPRGQVLRHRQHSALKEQEGLEGCGVSLTPCPPPSPSRWCSCLILADLRAAKAIPLPKQNKQNLSLPL